MIDYNNTVFALVKPPSRIISTHKVRDSSEHRELLKKTVERQLYLYYTDIEIIDGKTFAKQPWRLDWDSAIKNKPIIEQTYTNQESPESESEPEPEIKPRSEQEPESQQSEQDELKCPVCGKKCTSTPGRTLHVKSKHPEHFEEYKKSIK